jgi:hypothetical protein
VKLWVPVNWSVLDPCHVWDPGAFSWNRCTWCLPSRRLSLLTSPKNKLTIWGWWVEDDGKRRLDWCCSGSAFLTGCEMPHVIWVLTWLFCGDLMKFCFTHCWPYPVMDSSLRQRVLPFFHPELFRCTWSFLHFNDIVNLSVTDWYSISSNKGHLFCVLSDFYHLEDHQGMQRIWIKLLTNP